MRRIAAAALVVALGAPRPAAAQGTPPVTLLYQNFPNPFPTGGANATCVWFDLRDAATIRLAVYDIQGRLVRTLIPSPAFSGQLGPGYYGRAIGGPTGSGCDPNFQWDGRGSNGRPVPAGVYLLRLRVGGGWQTKKMVFRGL